MASAAAVNPLGISGITIPISFSPLVAPPMPLVSAAIAVALSLPVNAASLGARSVRSMDISATASLLSPIPLKKSPAAAAALMYASLVIPSELATLALSCTASAQPSLNIALDRATASPSASAAPTLSMIGPASAPTADFTAPMPIDASPISPKPLTMPPNKPPPFSASLRVASKFDRTPFSALSIESLP